jgi:hypothetical protein
MHGIALLVCAALAQAPLAPETVELSDHVELIVAHGQSWGLLGLDTCAHAPGQTPLELQIGEQHYQKGLGLHANGEIVVDLGGAFTKFEADVGVQAQGGTVGSVVFELFADDESLWKSAVMRPADAAVKVSVALVGRNELRLVATDAGDGITCDCADWCDARLTRAKGATPVAPAPRTDVARFAAVRSWRWQDPEGTRASRLDEFPAADFFPWSTPKQLPDGHYVVPSSDGFACIGLEWNAPRRLARVELVLDDDPAVPRPATEKIRVEQWVETAGGGSTWQGRWETWGGAVRAEANRLIAEPGARDDVNSLSGTTKVRWIVPAEAGSAIGVRQLVAESRSRWRELELLLTAERAEAGESATVEIFNGERRDAQRGAPRDGSSAPLVWDLAQPLRLPLTACVARHAAGDRTVLRIAMRGMAFGVAVADVLEHGGVLVDAAGLYVTDAQKPVALADYRARFEGKSSVLSEVRGRPEQTLAAATARLHQPQQDLGPTLLSLPADNRKFLVERDGTVRWDDRAAIYDAVDVAPNEGYRCAATVRFGEKRAVAGGRELADLECLGLEWKLDDGALHYTMMDLVTPPATGELRLAAENTGSAAAEAAFEIRFTHPAGVHVSDLPQGHGASVEADGRVLAWVTSGSETTLELTADGFVVHARVAPHGRAQARVLLPRCGENNNVLRRVVGSADASHRGAEQVWQGYLAETAQLDLPDRELERIVRASLLHCLAAARSHAPPEDAPPGLGAPLEIAPWIASVSYGPLESEAQAVLRGMQLLGAKSFASAGHRYFSNRVDRAGRLTTGYTLIGTGWHLWTLGEYDLLFQDDELLHELAPSMVRACRWIMGQRRKSMRDERDPHFGLMPPGPLADWNRFACYFYANANYCAGLRDAAAALARIHDPSAAEIAADAKAFRDDILRAWRFASSRAPVVPLRDGRFVPYFPTDLDGVGPVETFHPGEDAGRSWCYDVEVGPAQMVALGLLAPDAPEAGWILDEDEDVQYLRDGWFAYPAADNAREWFDCGGFAKVQPYYARTVETHALRDDQAPFIRSYYNTIPTLLNREDLSLWEHFAASGAWNKTHETGYFLAQTRTLLLTERDDELWLAPFVPRAWFADGEHLSVANAPTRFGPVGYSIDSHVAAETGGPRIEVTIDPPQRTPPTALVLRLRHPDRTPIRTVTVDGKESTTFDAKDGTIRIVPTQARITVRADY